MKTVGTKLDNAEYEIFEYCCNENGLNKSEQLRDLIKSFVHVEKESKELDVKPTTRGTIKRISYDNDTWIDIPELTNVTISD